VRRRRGKPRWVHVRRDPRRRGRRRCSACASYRSAGGGEKWPPPRRPLAPLHSIHYTRDAVQYRVDSLTVAPPTGFRKCFSSRPRVTRACFRLCVCVCVCVCVCAGASVWRACSCIRVRQRYWSARRRSSRAGSVR